MQYCQKLEKEVAEAKEELDDELQEKSEIEEEIKQTKSIIQIKGELKAEIEK